MASELSLTWDEHQSTLVGVFEKLLEAGALVDCTIAAEGQYLKAHKIILSACSPYFEMLFTEEKEKNPIVVLKDIKFQELKAMIDFIYRGKVKVPEERLGDFVDAAESLQIKGLGVGNRNQNSPEPTATESSAVTRKKEGRVSPLPRKRSRRSHGNNNADNIRVVSPPLEESTTTSSEELQQHQTQMDVASTSQRVVSSPSLVSATDGSSLYPSAECSEEGKVETSEPAPFTETSLPAPEQIPNPDNVVVKCEPEPMAEVYVPEIECFIEPKSEEVVLQETMLDCGSAEMEQAAGDSQHSSNQYSAFSSALQSSPSTSSGRSDNLMLMSDVGPSFTTSGALTSYAEDEVQFCGSALSQSPAQVDLAALAGTSAALKMEIDALPGTLDTKYNPRPSTASAPATALLPAPKQECRICHRSFPSAAALEIHMRKHRLHHFELQMRDALASGSGGVDTTFKCDMCHRVFLRANELAVHRRLHTGEKLYQCDKCDVASAYSSDLLRHKRVMHGYPPTRRRGGGRGSRRGV